MGFEEEHTKNKDKRRQKFVKKLDKIERSDKKIKKIRQDIMKEDAHEKISEFLNNDMGNL